MNIKKFITNALLVLVVVTLFCGSYSDVLANENKVEENQSIQKVTAVLNESNEEKKSLKDQSSSGVSQKIKSFFSGFIDDVLGFAVDNKIIKNNK